MAFATSHMFRNQQGKGLVNMPTEPSAGLSSMLKTSLLDQRQDNVRGRCQHASSDSFRRAGGVHAR